MCRYPSYPEVGGTRDAQLPAGYRIDRYERRLGADAAVASSARSMPCVVGRGRSVRGSASFRTAQWSRRVRQSCSSSAPSASGRFSHAASCTSRRTSRAALSGTGRCRAPRARRGRDVRRSRGWSDRGADRVVLAHSPPARPRGSPAQQASSDAVHERVSRLAWAGGSGRSLAEPALDLGVESRVPAMRRCTKDESVSTSPACTHALSRR